MKDSYSYVAVFDYADDGISISFPDLPGCLSCADTTEEALHNAEEVLGLFLYNMEEDDEDIPSPTSAEKIIVEPNQRTFLINVWMPLARHEIENYSIKKTLTIPQWLNKIAEEKKVNFSHVLQAALKDYLGIRERH